MQFKLTQDGCTVTIESDADITTYGGLYRFLRTAIPVLVAFGHTPKDIAEVMSDVMNLYLPKRLAAKDYLNQSEVMFQAAYTGPQKTPPDEPQPPEFKGVESGKVEAIHAEYNERLAKILGA
jgi:hypothetical protein